MFYLPYHYLCHLPKRLEDSCRHCFSSLPLIFVRETVNNKINKFCFSGTFSSSEGLSACRPCAKCPDGVPTLVPCSDKQDTQCDCDSGFFFWSEYKLCAACSKCSSGYGAVRQCSHQQDTMCQICGPGTYSEEHLSTKPCQKCKLCSDSEVEIRACLPNSDTLCMGEL